MPTVCRAIYIGSDEPLPTNGPWDKDNPKFHVGDSPLFVRQEDEPHLQEHLKTKFVAGTMTGIGCGCGFGYPSDEEIKSQRENMQEAEAQEFVRYWKLCRQSVDDLREYLTRLLQGGQVVRVLVTWDGDESVPPKQHLSVTPEFFGGDSFHLAEYTLYDVLSDGAGTANFARD